MKKEDFKPSDWGESQNEAGFYGWSHKKIGGMNVDSFATLKNRLV